MSEVISQEDIKKTQNALSKFIKEPPLTDKLLKKPPFRFLHDIIKSVIKETGFLSDKFTPEDLNLVNIKDKEGKIAFLKKLISAVKDATGSPISAKPNKIAAGLEVTKTLELLQAIGKGIILKQSGKLNPPKDRSDSKKNSKEKSTENNAGTVKKVKIKKDVVQDEGDKGKKKVKVNEKQIEESADKKKKNKVENEKLKKNDELNNSKNDKIQDGAKEVVNVKNEKKSADEEKLATENVNVETDVQNTAISSHKIADDNTELEDKNLNGEELKENNIREAPSFEILENGLSATKEDENKIVNDSEEQKKRDENSVKQEKRPTTRRQSSRTRPSSKTVNENVKKEVESKEKPRDSSARKVKKEVLEEPLPLLGTGDAPPISVPKIERPTTARKAPPSARAPGVPKAIDRGEVKLPENDKDSEVKPVEVITENNVEEDDKENIVVIEAQPLDNDLQDTKIIEGLENDLGEKNEGALVAQILESKKELEETKQIWPNTNHRNVEIDWETGRKQKRDNWEKEINKLRESIQELTRTTNPLGKLFDFIQEDVDSMQRELKSWVAVTEQYREQLDREQRLTENTLEKYKKQLAEVDSLIEQEQDAVRNIKANIIANDQRIFNLVTRGNASDH